LEKTISGARCGSLSRITTASAIIKAWSTPSLMVRQRSVPVESGGDRD
jgi:hypothetical protein